MASFSPSTPFDPEERLNYARHLLGEAARGGQAELQRLAAFLLLLEVLAYLQWQKSLDEGRHTGTVGMAEAEEEGDEPAAGGLASIHPPEGTRTATGDAQQGGVSGSAGAERVSAEWESRAEYLRTVVRPARL